MNGCEMVMMFSLSRRLYYIMLCNHTVVDQYDLINISYFLSSPIYLPHSRYYPICYILNIYHTYYY